MYHCCECGNFTDNDYNPCESCTEHNFGLICPSCYEIMEENKMLSLSDYIDKEIAEYNQATQGEACTPRYQPVLDVLTDYCSNNDYLRLTHLIESCDQAANPEDHKKLKFAIGSLIMRLMHNRAESVSLEIEQESLNLDDEG